MAYGANPPRGYPYAGKIPGCATLVFDIKLLEIDGKKEDDDSSENNPPVYTLPNSFGTDFGAHMG